ncbi:MAG: Ig-like domain-containing protein [Leptospiraceae bacterium]|nr:Ig-like domain-containing protein [Leptospiraceae bacterium]
MDKTGKEIATGITWKTSDGTIAGVDPASGLVTAVKVGDVIITATETSSSSAGTLNISVY